MATVIMVIGGSRSGKSKFAEQLAIEHAADRGQEKLYYIATGVVTDEEFAERIECHRNNRDQRWVTIEEPYQLADAIKEDAGVYLVDGIGTWVTNIMYRLGQVQAIGSIESIERRQASEYSFEQTQVIERSFTWDKQRERQCLTIIEQFSQACRDAKGTVILVADEVGMDVVPAYKESRVFRDLNGYANQILAAAADQVHLVVCGIPIVIKARVE